MSVITKNDDIGQQVIDEDFRKYKIYVDGVHKTYLLGTNAVAALRGVDLGIMESDFISIMGPSGCGKTTLLNLVGGLDYPTRGHIYLDGKDMSKFNENQLADLRRDNIGYVFQFYNLLPLLTALENIMIPLHFQGTLSKRARKRKAMELLKLVKLDDRADHTPSELSGGEQQRVAIARSFANDPEIVLLDEPTGDLDQKTGVEILNLLRDLNRKGATFLCVTHDAKVTEYGTRTIHVRDGKIMTGLEITDLKETAETKKSRQIQQKMAKESVERDVLKKLRELRAENITDIALTKLKFRLDMEEILEFLPVHFDDLVMELVETGEVKGTIDEGILYLQ